MKKRWFDYSHMSMRVYFEMAKLVYDDVSDSLWLCDMKIYLYYPGHVNAAYVALQCYLQYCVIRVLYDSSSIYTVKIRTGWSRKTC